MGLSLPATKVKPPLKQIVPGFGERPAAGQLQGGWQARIFNPQQAKILPFLAAAPPLFDIGGQLALEHQDAQVLLLPVEQAGPPLHEGIVSGFLLGVAFNIGA